jgi:hypothetical protein
MPNTKQPFIYTQKHKHFGSAASSTATIPNHGVTKITAAATYALAGPEVGSLVTLTAVGVDATIVSVSTVTGSTGQVSFNAAGGTQKLNLCYNSTVSNQDISVTLLGEGSTQWRIVNAWPGLASASTLEGVLVTTA